MSELRTRIQEDLKAALRAGEQLRLSTVRMLLAEIKRYEADKGTSPDEVTTLGLIEKMVKQRRDSESQYRQGGRPELADKEAAEIEILSSYLPQPLEADQLQALVEEAVTSTGASGPRDMGKVIAWLKPRVAGRADMGQLSARVKARLS